MQYFLFQQIADTPDHLEVFLDEFAAYLPKEQQKTLMGRHVQDLRATLCGDMMNQRLWRREQLWVPLLKQMSY